MERGERAQGPSRDHGADGNRRDEEQHGEGKTADAAHDRSHQGRRGHGPTDVVAEGESDAAGNQGGNAFHKR